MDLDVDYVTALVAAVLLGIGFVLQQYSAEQEPGSRFLSLRIFTDLLGKPRWLLGIACMVAGYLLAAWSIGHLELTLVEPLLTTYLVWALVLAVPMSRQAVKLAEVAGALILIGGVTLLSVTRSTRPVGLSFGSFSHWYAAAIIAGIAFAAVRAGHHRRGHVRATLTGLGAGLVFGIQDALTRQTLEILQGKSHSFTMLFTSWPAYALAGAGIVGLWLMQNAFSAAPLRASLPAIAAGEPVAGMALGIVVFGDRVQISAGTLAMEAGGIAALITGVVAVARSPAFSGLRRTSHATRPGPDSAGHRTQQDTPDLRSPDGSADRRYAEPHPAPGPRIARPTRRSPPGRGPGSPAAGQSAGKSSCPAHREDPHNSASGGDSRRAGPPAPSG